MSNTTQPTVTKPVSAPKRQVNRAKKQESMEASTAPTLPPLSASTPVPATTEAENITISHSIRITKDPVTNA